MSFYSIISVLFPASEIACVKLTYNGNQKTFGICIFHWLH